MYGMLKHDYICYILSRKTLIQRFTTSDALDGVSVVLMNVVNCVQGQNQEEKPNQNKAIFSAAFFEKSSGENPFDK